ncbi:MAG: hypothetical protein K1X57_12495 [Gemmataceae bacterium]|nr:hypothetical protein [Gemmataceae bacterium]
MGSWIRSLGAVLAGLVVAMLMIVGVEIPGSIVHPFPPGVDPTDIEVCRAHVANYPAWILMMVVVAWSVTAFVGAWVATRLGTDRHPAHGILVGLILLAVAVMNMSMLPYPIWFWAGNVIGLPVGFTCGAKLGGPRLSNGGDI